MAANTTFNDQELIFGDTITEHKYDEEESNGDDAIIMNRARSSRTDDYNNIETSNNDRTSRSPTNNMASTHENQDYLLTKIPGLVLPGDNTSKKIRDLEAIIEPTPIGKPDTIQVVDKLNLVKTTKTLHNQYIDELCDMFHDDDADDCDACLLRQQQEKLLSNLANNSNKTGNTAAGFAAPAPAPPVGGTTNRLNANDFSSSNINTNNTSLLSELLLLQQQQQLMMKQQSAQATSRNMTSSRSNESPSRASHHHNGGMARLPDAMYQLRYQHQEVEIPDQLPSSYPIPSPAASGSMASGLQVDRDDDDVQDDDDDDDIPSGAAMSEEGTSFYRIQSEQWREKYRELAQFASRFGHCLVPHKWHENRALANWVKRQRHQYKLKMDGEHSNLTDERQRMLETLGFVWDTHRSAWDERFIELCTFKQEHGHCNVPSTFPENKKLSIWVKSQRRQYKIFTTTGKSSSMTTERICRLNQIGFVFNPRNL